LRRGDCACWEKLIIVRAYLSMGLAQQVFVSRGEEWLDGLGLICLCTGMLVLVKLRDGKRGAVSST
jgi:hypothetical protein